METALARKAARLSKEGWTITSLTTEAVTATKREEPNAILLILGIIGLFFYCVPGLLLLAVAHLVRGQENVLITAEQAFAGEVAAALNAKQKAEKAAERSAALIQRFPWLADRRRLLPAIKYAVIALLVLGFIAAALWLPRG